MKRRILHIDMDAFFASVEQARNPELRGKPLIIGGDKRDVRGVVSTASYEARVYGVHSAMPLAEAKRLCPHGIFMRGNFARYQEASERVHRVLDTVSPLVEMASIDEAYVDVTGSQRLFGGCDAIAAHIRRRVRQETDLPCTVAIASNKLVAKVATEEAKPDGYLHILDGEEAAFLRPLPLQKLPGAGPRTCEMLNAVGVFTIGELADAPQGMVMDRLGAGGYGLQRRAQGIHTTPVEPVGRPKSISRETTFEKDLLDWSYITQVLTYLMERALYALRAQGLETKCITLKIRYTDFTTVTFSRTLSEPTSLDTDVHDAVLSLLPKASTCRERVRLVGIALGALSFDQHQMRLIGDAHNAKWERALRGVDEMRGRFGFEILRSGRSMALGKGVSLATPSLSR